MKIGVGVETGSRSKGRCADPNFILTLPSPLADFDECNTKINLIAY